MTTMNEIRKDLEDIQYFYIKHEAFSKAFDSVGKNAIMQTVEKYNAIMCTAPIRLFEIYVALYIDCCTYQMAAEKLCFSITHVYKMNKKILAYIYDYLNRKEEAA